MSIFKPVLPIILDHDDLPVAWEHFPLMEPRPKMFCHIWMCYDLYGIYLDISGCICVSLCLCICGSPERPVFDVEHRLRQNPLGPVLNVQHTGHLEKI